MTGRNPAVAFQTDEQFFLFVPGKWWGSKDKRTILCLHGWQDNANTFDGLIPLLPREFAYLALDLPGHGRSSHIPKGLFYRITDYLAVVRRVQEYLNWTSVSIIGHSYGGAMGFLFSSLYPRQVDLMVTIDLLKPTSWVPEKQFKKMSQEIEKMLSNDSLDPDGAPLYAKEDLVKRCLDGTRNSLTVKSTEMLLERGTVEVGGLYRLTRDVRLKTLLTPYFSQAELMKMAEAIETNFMFVKAEGSSFFEEPEKAESIMAVLRKGAKRFEYHTLPGTHHLHLNTPDVVAPVIGSFMLSTQRT